MNKSLFSDILTTMWIIYAVLAAITAAGVAIFAKLGLRQIDVVLASFNYGRIFGCRQFILEEVRWVFSIVVERA
ncbi:MAG: hypothetical protein UY00_C0056G0008 [Candidatus Wolfebacteria bacterium GW2011_GWA1_47_6]|nr:MAG: hypothetical protein UY00_C0056G0008 [Candidatus Wolfebacteria bacterium GW2011_GWA1_47_6]